MKVNGISIQNVKSFKSLEVFKFESNFNILIGPNASGKSNLLDILSITLRRFFLLGYDPQPQGNGKDMLQVANYNINVNDILEKYVGCDDPSLIEISFVVKKEDLENFKVLNKFKESLISFLDNKTLNFLTNPLCQFFIKTDWSKTDFIEEEILSYKIQNNVLEDDLNMYPYGGQDLTDENILRKKRWIFICYLRLFNLLDLYRNEIPGFELLPPFLFLSSYRGVSNNQDFQGNLSTSDANTAMRGLRDITSKGMTSLINIATLYFSKKRRQLESTASEHGYEERWVEDTEVKLVTEYLNRLGYGWSLKLIDVNRNIYEIQLKKEGYDLQLSQASSGEKEIINYLFGIFALKITNGLIIIDEPELHLHPRWQLLLLELFIDLTKLTKNQFLITTHSAIFINIKSVTNLIRIYKKDRETTHLNLKDFSGGSLKDLLHIVNSTNNEKIFFADVVVLVEGITDRLVFQKLLNDLLEKHKILSVIEVVEINGKGNIKKFRKYLKALKIPYYFIADLDYVNEVGSEAIKSLFVTDLGAVDSNAIKNSKSTDGKKLIEVLDEAIVKNDLNGLKAFSSYIKSFRRKLKDDMNNVDKISLEDFILNRRTENEFILSKGDIENYFPPNLSAKDLDNVISLLIGDELFEWQKSDGFKSLQQILTDILKDQKLIS